MCKQLDNDFMVQCDVCSLWFHFACVGVDENVKYRDWACEECSNVLNSDKQNMQSTSKNAVNPGKLQTEVDKTIRKSMSKKGSTASSSS